MIPLQIMLIAFAFFMIYVAFIHNRKHHIGKMEYYFWFLIWVGFSFLVALPQSFLEVAESLHIARVFDLLVILALMFIMLLTFYNRILYHRLNSKLERIIRDRALASPTE